MPVEICTAGQVHLIDLLNFLFYQYWQCKILFLFVLVLSCPLDLLKNLSAKGEISKLVIQALKEIGLNNQTAIEEERIIELLKKENPKHIMHDIKLAPVWIQKIMKKAL